VESAQKGREKKMTHEGFFKVTVSCENEKDRNMSFDTPEEVFEVIESLRAMTTDPRYDGRVITFTTETSCPGLASESRVLTIHKGEVTEVPPVPPLQIV